MTAIQLTGHVNEVGELRAKLPDGFPAGEVQITVTVSAEELAWEDQPWTPEEIEKFLTFRPTPASEIVTGGWEDLGITDSVAWVEEVRRQERERRGW